jgi:hypothetical protein
MKAGTVLREVSLKKGCNQIDLGGIYPLTRIASPLVSKVQYLLDDVEIETLYANKLIIEAKAEGKCQIVLGQGYYAVPDNDWTSKMLRTSGWMGGDGIYSFNLKNGNDAFDQKRIEKTLFVFGDTFIGRGDTKTRKRLEPLIMVNNSLAYYEEGMEKPEFVFRKAADGSVKSMFTLDPKYDRTGTVVFNLTHYDFHKADDGWLSGFNPGKAEIVFDLFKKRSVSHLVIDNYGYEASPVLQDRGVKQFTLATSDDKEHWEELGSFELEASNHIPVNASGRYFRMEITVFNQEGLAGLNKVKFYNGEQLYRDVEAYANTTLLNEPEHSWIWLQDGVVIDNYLYFFPMIINSDLTQPEGMQFCVKGVVMIKVPIVDGRLDPDKAEQKYAPLLVERGGSQWLFGGSIMSNTEAAGALNPDGYIYIYGYKTTGPVKELLLARVKAEDFVYFDDWTYYDGSSWSKDIFSAVPILGHISCEHSVSELKHGHNRGKYIAVFSYDVTTPQVCFSLAPHPWGPFSKPQKIYHCPDIDIYKSTTYCYNAKAHPHLSQSTSILASYNVNTYSLDHNLSDYEVYRPRFIRIIDTNDD